jgi:precorrin-2 dehydrogenase / sirohydrochlorin ferrochelatase
MDTPRPFELVSLLVAQKPCLVIGGMAEGEGRAKSLLEAGARLSVVAKRASPAVHELARRGALELRERPFEAGDLEKTFLALNTARDPALAEEVFQETRRRRCILATLDDAARSDIAFPAVARAGLLRLGVSTGGASPYLARRLREDLEAILSSRRTERLLAWLARRRAELRAEEPDFERRVARLKALLEGLALRGELVYPGAFLSEDFNEEHEGS